MTDAKGRLTVTLEPTEVEALRKLQDRTEKEQGYRPSAVQVVRGLLVREARDIK
jgi:hypothetical protein